MMPDGFRTIPEVVSAKAAENEDQPYLHTEDRSISYATLDERTNAIAQSLAKNGVRHGEPVCLYLYNSAEYLYTYIALAKLGAVAVPIDTRFSGATLEYVLSQVEADVLLYGPGTRDDYEAVRDELPSVATEYFVGDEAPPGRSRDFDELLTGDPTEQPDSKVDGSDSVSITYVQRQASERPRGVLLPQYSYVKNGRLAGQTLFEFTADDRIFTTLPLYSLFTFQYGIMSTLLTDAEFVLGDRFDPDVFMQQINDHEATVFLYLSRILSVLYNQESERDSATYTAEKAIGNGFGFGNDEDLISGFEERFGITVLEGYGVSPSPVITYNTSSDRHLGSVGKPAPHVDLEIVDESDWPVAPGETGEIVVRPREPHTMMQGYYEDPERTVADTRNQWIHTGDIGYVDEDGYLFFIANRENSINRGKIFGRFSSLEIESVIDSLPSVADVAVVGLSNEVGDEDIKAVVVPADDVELSPVDVCRHCEQQLTYLKVPRFIELRPSLPRNPSGKVQTSELREDGTRNAWDREIGYDLSR